MANQYNKATCSDCGTEITLIDFSRTQINLCGFARGLWNNFSTFPIFGFLQRQYHGIVLQECGWIDCLGFISLCYFLQYISVLSFSSLCSDTNVLSKETSHRTMSPPAFVMIKYFCFQKPSAVSLCLVGQAQSNTGVALSYQISLPHFGWRIYGESSNLLTSPWLTSILWACWVMDWCSGVVTEPWQVASRRPGRLEWDLVLSCCPDIQKYNG